MESAQSVPVIRWQLADTISANAEVGQGYNVYAYVANNPTTWVDPSGHSASGFAPPYDPGLFVGWKENIASMMQNAVQTFSFSAFGAWALRIGARMGTLATLAGGATAFNVVVGVLAVAAVLAMTYLIYSCLLNQNSWCYKSSTMQGLRGMASEAVQTITCNPPQSQFAAAGMAGMVLYNPKSAVNTAWRNQNPCRPEPKEEEENSQNQMRVQLQRSRSGVTMNTDGIPIMAPSKTGVTTLQVRTALSQLYQNAQISNWFPKSQNSKLTTAIVEMSQKLHRYPPTGTQAGGNIERSKWVDRSDQYRVDLENERGLNLRQ